MPVGPLFSGFPDGLTARVTFRGDLVHRFELGPNPFVTAATTRSDDPFIRALEERVAVAVLEQARARALLRWAADALRLHGLDALAVRVLSLAGRAGPEHDATVRRLRRWITRPTVTRWQTRRVGYLETTELVGLGAGPVSRAAGVSEDLRADDPAYGRPGLRAAGVRTGPFPQRGRRGTVATAADRSRSGQLCVHAIRGWRSHGRGPSLPHRAPTRRGRSGPYARAVGRDV